MIEIRYGDQYEVTDLAGSTVHEARDRYQQELGIPSKAYVKLNGSKLNAKAEASTVINDDDRLSFGVSRIRGAYFVAALLLALAVTGGVFAYGFINGTATLSATTKNYNFAEVTENTTGTANLTWTAYGKYAGQILVGTNGTGIFSVDTASSNYTGDLVVTVSYGNVDQLVTKYRVLDLQLGMTYPDGTPMDINESGTADTGDWVMLTLENGSVSMYPGGTANITQVRVTKGFYITQVKPNGVWGGEASPQLFCEVAQR